MKARRTKSIAAPFFAATMALAIWPACSSAAPQQFACALAGAADAPAARDQPLTVTFDDNAKTLQAREGDRNYVFADVSISNVAISGDVDAISIGIDRSSLGIVWQHYASDQVVTEYGQCRPNSVSSTVR